jgi:hypothetical protein
MTSDIRPRSRRPGIRIAAGLAFAIAVLGACTPAVTPSASSSGAGSGGPTTAPPTASPVADGIAHPTGAADVLLRLESGGGFVPVDFLATAAPSFTLYGDGTVVFRDPSATPPVGAGNVARLAPFQTVRLDEEGIQALLSDAIGRGGLGIATGPYIGQGADLPTTTFTITADGRTKEVSAMALSPEMHPQDVAIITALAGLAARLDGFASAVAGEMVYEPVAYRGTVMPTEQAFGPVIDWPWPGIKPADFVAGDNEFLKARRMSGADVAALGIPALEGGFQGLTLKSDGKLYTFSLRPLLPDETK